MPSVSKAQAKMMGADLARARSGKRTRTKMSQAHLKDFAKTRRKGLPSRARESRRQRLAEIRAK